MPDEPFTQLETELFRLAFDAAEISNLAADLALRAAAQHDALMRVLDHLPSDYESEAA